MTALAVRLYRRHGWVAPVLLYAFLAAATVATGGLALVGALVVERQVRARNARRAAA